MRKRLFFILLLSALFALAGCGTESGTAQTAAPTDSATAAFTEEPTTAPTEEPTVAPTATPEPTAAPVKMILSGSAAMQELAEELARSYMDLHDNITIPVKTADARKWVQNVGLSQCDIGLLSRDITPEEADYYYPALMATPVCYSGIALIVHKGSAVSDLTMEQIAAILTGEISNWSDAGGGDAGITVYTPGTDSEICETLLSLLGLTGEDSHLTGAAVECGSNAAVLAAVAADKGAIGIVALGSVDDTVSVIRVDGVEATADNVRDGLYALYEPFNMVTLGQPSGETAAFLAFALGDEGQRICTEAGYVPVR
jgi:phosphate transport system substrate-binding protein